MIRRITGQVAAGESQAVVLALDSVPALCLEVNVPDPSASELAVGATVTLYTHLHVRPEEMSLYGFLDERDYRFFLLLLKVSGVGPRAACNLLGTMAAPVLAHAIARNEPSVIARAPGIGRRTAQKVIMELADRIADLDPELQGLVPGSREDEDVLQALTQMGFSMAEAQQALRQVPQGSADVAERIRLALQQLG